MAVLKATLSALDTSSGTPTPLGDPVSVDFNPQTLSLSYRTVGRPGGQNAKDPSEAQAFTSQPTSFTASLSVELLFELLPHVRRNGGIPKEWPPELRTRLEFARCIPKCGQVEERLELLQIAQDERSGSLGPERIAHLVQKFPG